MNRSKITATIIIVLIIAFGVLLNYINQQVFPRVSENQKFPLRKEWNHCVDEQIREISTAGNEKILVKTNDALYAYDLDSRNLVWTASIKKQVESFPAVVADKRVFVSDNEHLWAFDLKTGKNLWKIPLDGINTWIPDASQKFVLLNTISDRVDVYDATSGNKLWKIQSGRGYTQAYIHNDIVYIVDHGIKAFEASTGVQLWRLDSKRAVGLSTFKDGTVYYIEYQESGRFDLVAYSTSLESELWRRNFVDNSPSGLYLYNGFLFLTENNALYQMDPEKGIVNWEKVLSDPTNLSFIETNVYVLEQFHRTIHVFEIESGKALGSLQMSFPRVIGFKTQEMIAVGANLVFSRGCEFFVFGN
jgi:outer membrane protein assembly factor BamB